MRMHNHQLREWICPCCSWENETIEYDNTICKLCGMIGFVNDNGDYAYNARFITWESMSSFTQSIHNSVIQDVASHREYWTDINNTIETLPDYDSLTFAERITTLKKKIDDHIKSFWREYNDKLFKAE